MRALSTALLLATFAGAQCPAPAKPSPCAALVPGTPLPYANAAAPSNLSLTSAQTVDLWILGHSENRGYHTFLQTLLDQNPPLPGVRFTVANHYIGGHEAWRWASPGQRGYRRIQTLLQARTNPTVVLGLFSNNAGFPIQSPSLQDPNYAKFVSELVTIADLLADNGNGARMIYLSAHRYKPSNFLPCYYENCAIGTVMQRAAQGGKAYLKAGPAQHDLHWCCFPACYAADLSHTNQQGDQLMAQTWYNFLVRELTGCATEPFGAGTPGTGGLVPVLGPTGGFPALGNAGFALGASDLRAGAQLAYVIGGATLPGPLLLVRPDAIVPATANAAGTHTLKLPVPPTPSFHGARVPTQVLALDPGAAIGISATQGLELHLCR